VFLLPMASLFLLRSWWFWCIFCCLFWIVS